MFYYIKVSGASVANTDFYQLSKYECLHFIIVSHEQRVSFDSCLLMFLYLGSKVQIGVAPSEQIKLVVNYNACN